MWATKEQAREFWPDAANIADATLETLLEVSTEQCVAYAPAIPQPYPQSYMLACVYQARELHDAGKRDGDVIGIGEYAIRSRPLTATVKSLLRPPRGPVVG